jgi:hypothetical protein
MENIPAADEHDEPFNFAVARSDGGSMQSLKRSITPGFEHDPGRSLAIICVNLRPSAVQIFASIRG